MLRTNKQTNKETDSNILLPTPTDRVGVSTNAKFNILALTYYATGPLRAVTGRTWKRGSVLIVRRFDNPTVSRVNFKAQPLKLRLALTLTLTLTDTGGAVLILRIIEPSDFAQPPEA